MEVETRICTRILRSRCLQKSKRSCNLLFYKDIDFSVFPLLDRSNLGCPHFETLALDVKLQPMGRVFSTIVKNSSAKIFQAETPLLFIWDEASSTLDGSQSSGFNFR